MPLISVIIPCYNHGEYLQDAVNSVVGGNTCLGPHPGQSFTDYEIVIVDDGSKDQSREIARANADRSSRVRWLHHEWNRGTASALNSGIKEARGEWIYILAADDMIEEWTLGAMVEKTRSILEDKVFYGDIQIISGGKRGQIWRLTGYDFEKVLYKNPMPAAGVFYPRACWEQIGGYPESMRWGREGWAFNIACGLAGWCGHHIGPSGYLYRWDGQNRSERTKGKRSLDPPPDGFRTWRDFYNHQIRELFPDAFKGVWMAGCCGGKRKISNPSVPSGRGAPAPELLGRDGMTIIEYIGPSVGKQAFWAENTVYQFGRSRPVGYVDNRHVAELLQQKGKRGEVLFRIKAVEAPAPKAEKVQPIPEPVEEIDAAPLFSPLPDPNDLTVREIKGLDLSSDDAALMLADERDGLNRRTAIQYLEGIAYD